MPVILDNRSFALASPEFHWPNTDEDARYSNPIERAGALLILELARVGWDVPGINVGIETYGGGEDLIRCVRAISGVSEAGPFELRFNATRARKGDFNVNTGLSGATIPPGIEITYFNDNSGPTAYRYTGKDWRADGETWIKEPKVNSKLKGRPKTYLRYSGWGGGGLMRHDAVLGREYSRKGIDPRLLDSTKLTAQIVKFIDELIASVSKMPTAPGFDDITREGDANLRRLTAVKRIQPPADFPLLYAWVDRNDAHCLLDVSNSLAKSGDRYGLNCCGWRLCGLGTSGLPERATDGFSFASTNPAVPAGHVIYGVRENSSPVVVRLKWLNDIFVVDNAAFDRAVNAAIKKIETENRFEVRLTNAELDECAAAVARTMVPATEYAGGFEFPVYLIGRQTAVDEVRMVKGPLTMSEEDGRIRVVIRDDETGCEFELFSRGPVGNRVVATARRAAEDYARLHDVPGRYRVILTEHGKGLAFNASSEKTRSALDERDGPTPR